MGLFNRPTIKTWFETGDFPTQAQFSNFIDSMFNLLEDTLPVSSIESLESLLNQKANKDASGMSEAQIAAWQTALDISGAVEGVEAVEESSFQQTDLVLLDRSGVFTAVPFSAFSSLKSSFIEEIDLSSLGKTIIVPAKAGKLFLLTKFVIVRFAGADIIRVAMQDYATGDENLRYDFGGDTFSTTISSELYKFAQLSPGSNNVGFDVSSTGLGIDVNNALSGNKVYAIIDGYYLNK